ncbi:class I SAM-dependent methyltransferase [uncultured Imperialibacter sp.]|uniref:class I SAM-dependent methyltransferase n=1 Tax=uncultured Imperialibacter sp. TaxID=1672639 RepID=UPI0030D98A04|tara:strand:+ start:19572 stop:20399 length:828 start_codon:yes stop_codon:yes gene_type:complete
MKKSTFDEEIEDGRRFSFGENWNSFLKGFSEERLTIATESLKKMLRVDNLHGKSFLDIGCGSGLFSLAAHRLGARVMSLDFDPNSVQCANILKDKYGDSSLHWAIAEGSVLDQEFMLGLGKYDYVYSWGVLHHTGDMIKALHNATLPLEENGTFFIGIYNDQGRKSIFWRKIKESYNSNFIMRGLILSAYISYMVLRMSLSDVFRFKNPFSRYSRYKELRGMSIYHDWVDWIGGLPFEVASPQYIVDFFFEFHNLKLIGITTTSTNGINEYVFVK